ncbi:hypothetical protein F4821DRAFT_279443 [Hypoxylon rubiginosum]|uniref:Uncharacterized protein n=1 Tax=Hypoxylon rubiginosum TaxID=110542 RepID=A0ACC0DHK7_9PEZI|nr:hypothetical protein F4821DRAFT_279443 [Hypoxylon rubiginosum]
MSDISKQPQKCDVCGAEQGVGVAIKLCGGCKSRSFCGTTCQRKDWPSHKKDCHAKLAAAKGKKWYDRYRKCQDGTQHFGELELITWGGRESTFGEEMGWGNCLARESADLKRKYEEEFKSDDVQMYKYWPQGFRWTCCGLGGDQRLGCDHHGTGPDPCQCDFCHMGKPLPDSIYKKEKIERRGLKLSQGPDKRSFNKSKAETADVMRTLFGMPE